MFEQHADKNYGVGVETNGKVQILFGAIPKKVIKSAQIINYQINPFVVYSTKNKCFHRINFNEVCPTFLLTLSATADPNIKSVLDFPFEKFTKKNGSCIY